MTEMILEHVPFGLRNQMCHRLIKKRIINCSPGYIITKQSYNKLSVIDKKKCVYMSENVNFEVKVHAWEKRLCFFFFKFLVMRRV